jgi:PAS domain S-box-containing protein
MYSLPIQRMNRSALLLLLRRPAASLVLLQNNNKKKAQHTAFSTTITTSSALLQGNDIVRSLPTNLADAFLDRRAIVVTEPSSPFRIIAVNRQWEDLCGYTQKESKGETLSQLIQGPHTNVAAVRSVVQKASKVGGASAVVSNYSKDGREFRNRLQVGPLKDHKGNITHFVGVLEEVNPMCDRSFDDRYSMHSSMTTVV